MLGRARIFYSTACTARADKLKFGGNSNLSSCVMARLAACNALVNATGAFFEWTPVSTGSTLSVVDTSFSGYILLPLQRIFAVPFAIAQNLVTPTGLATDSGSSTVRNDLGKTIVLPSLLLRTILSHLFSEWLSIHRSYIASKHRCRTRRSINSDNDPANIDRHGIWLNHQAHNSPITPIFH